MKEIEMNVHPITCGVHRSMRRAAVSHARRMRRGFPAGPANPSLRAVVEGSLGKQMAVRHFIWN